MCNNKECARHFKARRAYHRCFEEFRKKWESCGKVTGRITLKQTSEEERRAVGGIIGKVFYEESIRFSFSEFEQGLQKTRFAPVDMKEVLEEYFGERLVTARRRKKEEEDKKSVFLNRIREYFEENDDREAAPISWIHEMISEKKYGYRLLMREYTKDDKQAELLVQNVGKALMKLKESAGGEEAYPLAVLAADITGNPHYFDRGTAAGQLFVHAICYGEKAVFPESAHQWRKLLMQAFVVPDNISSMIHAYGLRLLIKEGRHPAYDSFCDRGEPYVITMENMKGVTGVQTAGRRVYAVENEMVFSYLLSNLQNADCTLLCTSGQPRSVAQVLFSYILDSGIELYYNGDMDPDGVCIADRLWKRFGDRIHIWRMSPEDYEKSLSKEKIVDTAITKLEAISHPILKKTAVYMRKKQLAGYQENILEELLEDIKS